MKGERGCEHQYGFLPCAETIVGHIFLIGAYEFFMFHGESYVAGGGQRIFKMLGPGAFGACAFQLIGSLPEALVLLATGLLNRREEGAEEYVLIAVGLVAGSSIFLLTLLWGTCILLSTHRFSSDSLLHSTTSNLFLSLWPGYGVVTDSETRSMGRMMVISVIPFAIIQIPRLSHSFSSHFFVLLALLLSIFLLISYFFYQMFRPWIQKRQLLYLKHRSLETDILKHVQNQTKGRLFTHHDGAPNLSLIKSIFQEIDRNGDNYLTASELRGFQWSLLGQDRSLDISAIRRSKINDIIIIEQVERNGDDELINEDEFITNLSILLNPTSSAINQTPAPQETIVEENDYQKKWEETDKVIEDRMVDKSVGAWMKAISLVILGILMLGVAAEPLIHSVQNLSKAAKIPSFFIAFIFIPLATNARIAASAITEARRKKESITSMALSEIYGAVLMNNLLGMSVLLSLVYFRGLTWRFSLEMMMVLMVTSVMGCVAGFTTVFPLWISIFAYLLYPLSLFLVNHFGDFEWSS